MTPPQSQEAMNMELTTAAQYNSNITQINTVQA